MAEINLENFMSQMQNQSNQGNLGDQYKMAQQQMGLQNNMAGGYYGGASVGQNFQQQQYYQQQYLGQPTYPGKVFSFEEATIQQAVKSLQSTSKKPSSNYEWLDGEVNKYRHKLS